MGSLEALALELKEQGIEAIKRAEVGNISKHDVIESSTVKDRYLRVILGFNVGILPDAKDAALQADIPVFTSEVIYQLLASYEEWVKGEREKEKRELLERIPTPAKLKILPGCIFRQSRPAIVGVEVLAGKIRTGVELLNPRGANVGPINEIQDKGENISRADQGMQVAIALRKPVVGRHIYENDVLYVHLTEEEIADLKRRSGILSVEEAEVLDELWELKLKKQVTMIE
jgi:translation initiation factor 5B